MRHTQKFEIRTVQLMHEIQALDLATYVAAVCCAESYAISRVTKNLEVGSPMHDHHLSVHPNVEVAHKTSFATHRKF
jgi:hypothetical protein